MNKPFIHPHALVESDHIGSDTRIWAFAHVLKGAVIGSGCNICDHCYIEYGVTIGNDVTIKSGVYLWEGISIQDHAFIGPNAVFTNDIRPRSKQYIKSVPTLIKQGATIGANSTILAGITIGAYAMTGIGAVVTRNVPDHALVYGNPAKIQGWVDEQGEKLIQLTDSTWSNASGMIYIADGNGGLKKQ